MIKVCHITSAHAPEDVRIFHKECTSLANAGYEVYLVERGDSYKKYGVHIVGVGAPPSSRLSRMTSFAKKIYKTGLSIDADIYHFHDPELLPYGLKLKKKGKIVIFDSHENYSEQMKIKPYLPDWVTKPMAKAYRRYEFYAVKHMDAVIFPCSFRGEKLYNNICRNSILIDNVPNLNEFYFRYDKNIKSKDIDLCYIGSLNEARCISEIIEAATRLQCTLLLAGTCPSQEYQTKIKMLIEKNPLIQWVENISREEVYQYLSRAKIGLCPEKTMAQYNMVDNLATKSYEYMAMGLPVIAADYPFAKKVMETYEYGCLINPNNVSDIAFTIRHILNHPEEAERMGENGRRAVKKEFNWSVEEKKLLALYQKLLAERT